MAALKKFLKGTKNKIKTSKSAKKSEDELDENEEFRKRKQQWQIDLEEMSEFLVIKSTEEQKQDGVSELIDTAFIDDRDGLPVLKAVFDLHHFQTDDVTVEIENDQLLLVAQCNDDSRECSFFRKTMIRRLDLPKYVETRQLKCYLSPTNILTLEMPFHLPAQKKPSGPGIVPIEYDSLGRRKIKLRVPIGKEFVSDEVEVNMTDGQHLTIKACYNEEVGHYGSEITRRCIDKTFKLPDKLIGKVEAVDYYLAADGTLNIEIYLKKEQSYKCQISREEIITDVKDDSISAAESELEESLD
ncbi:hypothetical protein HELRODRAFT_190314 [Helobdella robusta]|uniref:SHSP domain-containing protein n=1 Tax=Helobdella robusta TaxID=6412 RepID=T1FRW3_HELRO|nr:hypothetical protein HELRODRAFT_190314 [Helobdella robusta]ESO09886.1 hypothetical protein HELRODRAFT_190314 [Helobdella robusta]